MRASQYEEAIRYYADVLLRESALSKSITANLVLAKKKYRASRRHIEKPRVAVCGWELAHNAAGRAYTLATLYETFAEVEIIGSLFPRFGRELWEPIRETSFARHSFVVEEGSRFMEQAIELVAAHPYDIVHLSKPRAPNILFGTLYKLLWDAKVLVDIDDEELAFVGADTPIGIDDYLKQYDRLPALDDLASKDWTRLAVGLAGAFDGITVSNPALQQRYGGEIIRHARDEKRFTPSQELKRQSREKYGIPQDKKVVLFFGTPRKHKGLTETAEAIAALKRKDVLFVIVGDFSGAFLKSTLEQVKGCEILFIGNQPFSAIPEVVSIADLCVLLQDESTAANYQVPAKLTDALAMGVPTLASFSPALEEFFQQGAIEKISLQDIKPRLSFFLQNEEARNTMARQGRSVFIDTLSVSACSKNLRQVLDKTNSEYSLQNTAKWLWTFLQLSPGPVMPLPSRVKEVKEPGRTGQIFELDGNMLRSLVPLPVYLPALRESTLKPVTVVVPVYNSPAAVEGCLASLAAYALPIGASVLMIDDASSDERIAPLLQRFHETAGFRLVCNPQNLGYTRTVNCAIELCAGQDVVLLNSDTIVTPRWLHHLRYCVYSQPDIGTATAVSDNAGAFSVPEIATDNPEPAHLDAAAAARAIVHAGSGEPLDAPTGNGFCLYLRRDALEVVGNFDERRFPRGYGEENDLCMRIMYSGRRNVVCDKSYVRHLRSQSFGESKKPLLEAGARQLAESYPEYKMLTARFHDVEFSQYRDRVRQQIKNSVGVARPLPRVLYVISTQTGGTPQTNLDLMRAMSGFFEPYLLRCDSFVLTLSRLENGELAPLETVSLHFPILPLPHRSNEYDRIVADMMYRHSIELLHIRHIIWHSLGLAAAAKALGIPVVYSLHDFYTLCPSINMMGADFRFLGPFGAGQRRNSLWQKYPFPDGILPRWRANMSEFLKDCDAFVTTSKSAAAYITAVFPKESTRLHVIPHGRDFTELMTVSALRQPYQTLRVLAPGNINQAKGALLLCGINAHDRDKQIEFHFLGSTVKEIKQMGIHHGKYRRDEFTARVRAIAPQIGIVLSICPETWCHTLTEMWACGLPVLALDIGAVGERIRQHGGGWLLPATADSGEIYAKLLELSGDLTEIAARSREVVRWQTTEALTNDNAAMSVQYRVLYRRLLYPKILPVVRVGLVLHGVVGYRATAHIRLLGPLRAEARKQTLDPRPISVEALLVGAANGFDVVIIQRDAVPPRQVDALLNSLRQAGVPWVFEIDDKLWDLPNDHTDHRIDEVTLDSMRRIAAGAVCVTTSTHSLTAQARIAFGASVETIPNALDEGIWCTPLAPEWIDRICREQGLNPGKKYLLYMGARSHAKDLELVAPAMERILRRFPDLCLLQIGGGFSLPGACMIEAPKQYSYPEFVAWFRAVCSPCILAIAPLRDNDFNRCKSDIKFLDYALAGVPAVFSRVGPYSEVIEDGVTGLLCDNTISDWEFAIERLLSSELLRKQLACAAQIAASARLLKNSGVSEQWLRLLQAVHRQRIEKQ